MKIVTLPFRVRAVDDADGPFQSGFAEQILDLGSRVAIKPEVGDAGLVKEQFIALGE